jgi:hypothetical protein
MRGSIKIWFILILLLPASQRVLAQHSTHTTRPINDTILLGGVVENGDTIAMIFLPDVDIWGKLPPHYARDHARQIARNNELRYNVYKVYPYAVVAADLLKNVDVDLAKLDNDRRGRKAYLKALEKELNNHFKGELENLSITQGQILVRLIDRQTGKNCYSIVKELKGGFSAVVWQSVALLFSNNLKREYDPTDRDKDIEDIVKELEISNYNHYQYYKQQTQLHTSR